MNRRTIYGWTAMTLLGLLTGAANADESVVRVSDSPPAGAPSAMAPSEGAPSAGAPLVSTVSGAPVDGGPVTMDSNVVVGDSAGVGVGVGGDGVGVGVGGVGVGGDVGVFRLGGCLRNVIGYNPYRGYHPPSTVAVERDAVMFYSYWPAKFYGQPGFHLAPSYPMVYTPTDTTQLGVYYARVPQWQPNPRMYPRPPRPQDWGRRATQAYGMGGGCNVGVMAAGYTQPTPAGTPTPDSVGSPAPPMSNPPAPQMMTIPPAPKMAPPPAPQGN